MASKVVKNKQKNLNWFNGYLHSMREKHVWLRSVNKEKSSEINRLKVIETLWLEITRRKLHKDNFNNRRIN